MKSLLAALMVVKLSMKNLWPHVQVVDALSQSSSKEVQVRVSVFSGTLSEGYRWKDRHGIEKTFRRVAKSLGSWGKNNESGWGKERTETEAVWGSKKPEKETKKGLGSGS
ncbi:hypothetical protein Tco_0805075 [Tanacetum coccineum]